MLRCTSVHHEVATVSRGQKRTIPKEENPQDANKVADIYAGRGADSHEISQQAAEEIDEIDELTWKVQVATRSERPTPVPGVRSVAVRE